jgi:hypothetical protein
MRIITYIIDTIKEIAPVLFFLFIAQQVIWAAWVLVG